MFKHRFFSLEIPSFVIVVSSVLLTSMLFIAAPVSAEFRVATVDINKVLNESDEAREKRKELDELSKQAKDRVEEKRAKLQKQEQTLKDKKAKEDSEEVAQFRAEAKELARYVKDTEEELRRKFMASNEGLTQDVLKVVQKFAKSNNLDLVLNKSDSGRGPVLFGTSTVDITEEIIEEVNG